MPFNKTLLLILFITLAILGLYFFVPKTPKHAPAPKLENSNVRAKSVEIHEVSPDKKSGYHLKAKTMDLLNNDFLVGNKVDCTMLTEKEECAQLHSQKANFNSKTKDLFLVGHTIGEFKEFQLNGSNFSYEFATHTISTENPATLQNKQLTVTANKSIINLRTNTFFLMKGVKTIFESTII